ncbi:hypothetical protein V6N11_065973 [Hibiscus sabdariffa]|uniref:DUF506 family protein n=1 Tax=Hibiscus sabdariffa TaxID=183260 RepID=A0ABR2NUW4_9ROSI
MAASDRRIKRVSDPLDDRVKARLVGASYESSGSEHSAAAVVEDDSPCLSELVHGFLEDDHDVGAAEQKGYNSDSDRVDSSLDISVIFRRNVMAYLREVGHNAAICKTKWSSSGGLTAGNYEFIDVVQSVSPTWQIRYFVDLDFTSEFEIARPTGEYSRLLHHLPRVFVGKDEELKRTVKVMSEWVKKSLKSKELTLPPWRKNRYMQNKWFGPYRRTANSNPSSTLTIDAVNIVQCRSVGFEDAVKGRLFVRTR